MYECQRSNQLAAENCAEANTRIYSLKINELECLLKRPALIPLIKSKI